MRLIPVLIAALGACGFQPGRVAGDGAIDAPSDAAPDALVLGAWGMPVAVGLPGPTTTDDDPSMTDDRRELFINSARAGNADVYVATRATVTEPWPTPVLVIEVSTLSGETTPEISADGLSMILASDRPGTKGVMDLWRSTRASRSAAWTTPIHVPELSSPSGDASGNITPDGKLIVFSSDASGSPDLFYAQRTSPGVTWQTPVEIVAVNTTFHEGSPYISADGLTLYFDTNRDGTYDLYTSHRAARTDPFPAPTPIVEINTPSVEVDPWLALDGRRLMFSSNRSGTNELWEATR